MASLFAVGGLPFRSEVRATVAEGERGAVEMTPSHPI